eukprot:CAMPEP_0117542312 /NCGR_PEP_ID=MMETSP0784-20121206/44480_1 /TAXON_ID=39447 /ORGANISM="" /LENGTH=60 /DNA_ID=CAMNT_0005339055 /DNA_START=41 /DNA_END=223 /DNA_ORIENTATION=+
MSKIRGTAYTPTQRRLGQRRRKLLSSTCFRGPSLRQRRDGKLRAREAIALRALTVCASDI